MSIIGISDVLKWGRGVSISFENGFHRDDDDHVGHSDLHVARVRIYNRWSRVINIDEVWFSGAGMTQRSPAHLDVDPGPGIRTKLEDGERLIVTYNARDFDPEETGQRLRYCNVRLANGKKIRRRITDRRLRQLTGSRG